MIIFIIVLIIIAIVFILMVMGGLESYDPKSDNKGFVSNNISDSATKDEPQKNKKIECLHKKQNTVETNQIRSKIYKEIKLFNIPV